MSEMVLGDVTLYVGDALETLRTLPDESVHCVVTSPPYFGLRDYGIDGQLGAEPTPDEYVAALVEVFREARRVLRDDGTVWLNLGDSYIASATGSSGSHSKLEGGKATQIEAANRPNKICRNLKSKQLIGIPWRVAFALQADGWYLRQDIIWHKPNPMPESVQDRCTKAHEYLFLLTKSPKYYYDNGAIKEPANGWAGSEFHTGKTAGHQHGRMQKTRPSRAKGEFNGKTEAMADTGQNAFRAVTEQRNKRSVWTVPTQPFAGAHFAVFPPKLIEPCILAGCPQGGTVLDPFAGSGTTGEVAVSLGRKAILIELSPEYAKLIRARVTNAQRQGRLAL